MAKKRSMLFNILTSFITRIYALFGTFLVTVLLARFLGPQGQGIVAAVFVFPNIMNTLADLGVRQSAAYFTGKDKYNINTINSSILTIWLFSSMLAIIASLAYFSIFLQGKYSWTVLGLALLTIPLRLLYNYYKGVVQGFNQIQDINRAELIRIGLYLLGTLILVGWFNFGVEGAALTQVIMGIVVAAYFIWIVNSHIDWKELALNLGVSKEMFFRGFPFAFALFINTLNYRVDIIILNLFVADSAIGIYSVGTNFAELVWQLPAAIGLVLFSSGAISKNEKVTVSKATKTLRIAYPFLIVICVAIMIFAPIFIPFLYGEAFSRAAYVIALLMPGVIALVISKVLHPDISGRGYPLYAWKAFVFPLILNIVLNFMLIPTYGIYGAAISSTVSYVIGGVLYAYLYSKREKLSIKDLLIINKKDLEEIKFKMKTTIKKIRN